MVNVNQCLSFLHALQLPVLIPKNQRPTDIRVSCALVAETCDTDGRALIRITRCPNDYCKLLEIPRTLFSELDEEIAKEKNINLGIACKITNNLNNFCDGITNENRQRVVFGPQTKEIMTQMLVSKCTRTTNVLSELKVTSCDFAFSISRFRC